ncbi:hypothetical protein K458DRAFT_437855 [Lentithecium fluviatile CBS 122367]|uniref:MARVEL domain-containing protein n=1 Tax=Lentithecium fluviatile CBS 122367 TaxID=1168545 RepID=A0A6G1IBM2_9PLEO|nr:hypothetical protein K458DRAFT_437855 [Lentithecium fluviatile CBS 122367]
MPLKLPPGYPLQNIHHNQSDNTSKPPRTFGDAIHVRLDNPLVSLFRLGIRLLQLIFALAAGISYAIELAYGSTASAFIYSQVVFGLTFITLITDALTLRSYRLTFVVESTLCVLWLALFGVFYRIYLGNEVARNPEYAAADMKRMKTAIWLDLVNFILWLTGAVFSTAMCCSGIKAAIRGKLERRTRKKRQRSAGSEHRMEEGVVRNAPQARSGGRLPLYEEIAAVARSS